MQVNYYPLILIQVILLSNLILRISEIIKDFATHNDAIINISVTISLIHASL